jgi:hypothetical protein
LPRRDGRQSAFLDEAAARVRAPNNQFLDPSVGTYKGG